MLEDFVVVDPWRVVVLSAELHETFPDSPPTPPERMETFNT